MARKFSDFKIEPDEQGFVGTKVDINQIFDKDITVVAHKIKPSKFPKNEGDMCLYLQFKIGELLYVTFTPSKTLMNLIGKVPVADGFPFDTKIIRNNGRLEFK